VQDLEERTFREAIESKESKTLKLVGLPQKPRVVGCKESLRVGKTFWRLKR
jgi:hypothetical protein